MFPMPGTSALSVQGRGWTQEGRLGGHTSPGLHGARAAPVVTRLVLRPAKTEGDTLRLGQPAGRRAGHLARYTLWKLDNVLRKHHRPRDLSGQLPWPGCCLNHTGCKERRLVSSRATVASPAVQSGVKDPTAVFICKTRGKTVFLYCCPRTSAAAPAYPFPSLPVPSAGALRSLCRAIQEHHRESLLSHHATSRTATPSSHKFPSNVQLSLSLQLAPLRCQCSRPWTGPGAGA